MPIDNRKTAKIGDTLKATLLYKELNAQGFRTKRRRGRDGRMNDGHPFKRIRVEPQGVHIDIRTNGINSLVLDLKAAARKTKAMSA